MYTKTTKISFILTSVSGIPGFIVYTIIILLLPPLYFYLMNICCSIWILLSNTTCVFTFNVLRPNELCVGSIVAVDKTCMNKCNVKRNSCLFIYNAHDNMGRVYALYYHDKIVNSKTWETEKTGQKIWRCFWCFHTNWWHMLVNSGSKSLLTIISQLHVSINAMLKESQCCLFITLCDDCCLFSKHVKFHLPACLGECFFDRGEEKMWRFQTEIFKFLSKNVKFPTQMSVRNK